ncbi:O-antigen ligase family protein [Vibrio methylphosphonaticus]|uniref:O-antigen ligase family protein n=1 Tax=Vibrio methylphosphonaticus TaxID=2946866 RepID=UPI00202A1EC0|nr:O-antigen ligase family protein [Vibrio methylphosphonaticus]MCL9774405.1 O-antigen ligase family protein [Vibrio methylphosphonaticus]
MTSTHTNPTAKHGLLSLGVTLCIGLIWWLIPHPALGLALSLLPIAILFVLSQTFWLVTLFIVFSFFRIHEVFPVLYPLKFPLILSAGALGALLWHTLISQQVKLYWHRTYIWLIAFWGLVIIGVILAANRGVAIAMFNGTYWKIMVMTLAVSWLITSPKELSRFSFLMVTSGLLVGCVALFNSVNGIGLVEGSRVTIGRDFGSMLGDPNDLALVLMFPLAFAIGAATTKGVGGFFRTFSLVTSIVLLLAVIATQSRGGLLGSMAVFGVYAWRLIPSKTLFFSLSGIAALALYAVAGISDRASGGAEEAGIDASAMGRLYAWEAAYKMALDNPIFGVGLDNFYYNYFFYSPHWDGVNHAVHSTWFGVLAETGFLGLGLFIMFIYSLVKCARQTLKTIDSQANVPPYLLSMALAVYSGLIGTIVSGTFLTQGFNWPIYLLAALTIAVSQIASQFENSNPR